MYLQREIQLICIYRPYALSSRLRQPSWLFGNTLEFICTVKRPKPTHLKQKQVMQDVMSQVNRQRQNSVQLQTNVPKMKKNHKKSNAIYEVNCHRQNNVLLQKKTFM